MTDPLAPDLRAACPLPLTVVGVGNSLRGDDGFGPAVLAALPPLGRITCLDTGMVPENWLGPIARSQPAAILILDAADLDQPPGSLALLAPDALEAAAGFTHGIPLGFFLELLAQRCDAPARVLAARPQSVALGAELSAPMRAAVARAAALVRGLAEQP